MSVAPVGLRCPEHAGGTQRSPRVMAARQLTARGGTIVTTALIVLNVLVYFGELAQGASASPQSGSIFTNGVLFGPAVAQGDWWRLITAAFLHGSPIHLGFNMLALYWFGSPLEQSLGRGRFLLLYLVSGLAGSAGALIANPTGLTVGASGAIFGMLGAALVFERQGHYVFGGQALGLIVLNLVFTFAIPNISIGGHLGGLAGGILGGLILTRFGRGHAAYGRLGLSGLTGLLLIGVASVAVAYWKVRGYS
jgi:membrane associated rhomboid family serine protease